jgi:hypothetical protein
MGIWSAAELWVDWRDATGFATEDLLLQPRRATLWRELQVVAIILAAMN